MAQINDTAPDLPHSVPEPIRRLVFACIAKAPSDRPTTSALLARAAQALRRGDVLAAASAVPAVLPAGVAAPTMAMQTESSTTVLPSQAPGFDTMLMGVPGAAATSTTTAYPSTPPGPPTVTGPYGTGDGPHDDGPRKRSAWTIPLVILIVLLAVLLGAFLFTSLTANKSNPGSSTTPKSGGTSSSAAADPSGSATPIVLDPSQYYDKQYTVVKAQLEALGLTVTPNQQPATAASDAGKVTLIDPLNTRSGDTVTVTYYGASTALEAPGVAPSSSAGKTVTPGQAFTITWPSYTCAAGGGGALSGWTVKLSGAAASTDDIPLDASPRSATITAGASAGTISIRYSANCGAAETPNSPALKVTVKAPATTAPVVTPTPTPTPTATAATQ
jgi:serine/threonine-protein kinase